MLGVYREVLARRDGGMAGLAVSRLAVALQARLALRTLSDINGSPLLAACYVCPAASPRHARTHARTTGVPGHMARASLKLDV